MIFFVLCMCKNLFAKKVNTATLKKSTRCSELCWHPYDPRCASCEMRSSEVQRLGQVVRDMDGQFSSGVCYSPGETEVSVSCLTFRARKGN